MSVCLVCLYVLSVCMSFLSVCLVCLYVLSVCMLVCLYVLSVFLVCLYFLSVCMSFLSVCLVCLYVLSVCMSCLSVCLCIYVSVCLSVYLLVLPTSSFNSQLKQNCTENCVMTQIVHQTYIIILEKHQVPPCIMRYDAVFVYRYGPQC